MGRQPSPWPRVMWLPWVRVKTSLQPRVTWLPWDWAMSPPRALGQALPPTVGQSVPVGQGNALPPPQGEMGDSSDNSISSASNVNKMNISAVLKQNDKTFIVNNVIHSVANKALLPRVLISEKISTLYTHEEINEAHKVLTDMELVRTTRKQNKSKDKTSSVVNIVLDKIVKDESVIIATTNNEPAMEHSPPKKTNALSKLFRKNNSEEDKVCEKLENIDIKLNQLTELFLAQQKTLNTMYCVTQLRNVTPKQQRMKRGIVALKLKDNFLFIYSDKKLFSGNKMTGLNFFASSKSILQ